ncbi:LamG-like jellyroll fold domain-containing protein [Ramlibacter tataouinensis]|nr:LamG-like jellyroll fold domain-containing protein [Ramlibacter tataouinensis]
MDARSHDRVGLGSDGACYCKYGLSWDDNRRECVNIQEIDNTRKPPSGGCSAQPGLGNPIHPLTGAKRDFVKTGIAVGGLELVLTYDSTIKSPSTHAYMPSEVVDPNAFGLLWNSSFHRKLRVATNSRSALLTRGDGKVLNFRGNGGGGFSPAEGDNANKLQSVTGGYLFTDVSTGDQERFDTTGKLMSISTAKGDLVTFTHEGENMVLAQAADGRVVRFRYSGSRIVKIWDANGAMLTPTYDGNGNLASLTWQDQRQHRFLYESPAFPWALTGKVDENNNRYATFTYDAEGRAIATEYAGGVDRFTVSYGSPPLRTFSETYDAQQDVVLRVLGWQPPSGVSITRPNGAVEAVGAEKIAGMPSMVSRSQPAGSGCAASSSGVAYDALGNIVSSDDFQGNRTCYAYDGSNRETTRVEGLASAMACSMVLPPGSSLPAGARRITTTWHPDLKKPAIVTEPLRKVTTVYHAQPDPFNGNATASCSTAPALPNGKPLPVVCKIVEESLLPDGGVDTAVPGKTKRFTYDSAGRLLTSVDPNNRTTTYAYFSDTLHSGAPYDPDISKVSLLLHGNGLNGSVSVPDDSPFSRGVRAVGNAAVSTAQSKFGGAAIAFDGDGDYVEIPYDPDLGFGAADFTIEMFVQKTANNPNYSRLWNPNGDVYDGVSMFVDHNGNFGMYLSTNGTSYTHQATAIANLANGQWYHLAVVRSGGSIFAFVNGVKYIVTTTLGTTHLFNNTTHARVIGGQSGVNRALYGYVDEVRITKGKARYTENFTPPTQEFVNAGGHGVAGTGHTVGDLQSITNAAGQVTQFTQYNPAGRLRQMVDPKGVTTDITYTPRGFVSTVSVTPQGGSTRTTTYTYDNAGQMTGVALPDGTTLSYSYDAAHRLVGVTDARGNAITYTLDNTGNRTGEEVRDPTGALQRSISRSFDALNRLQQVTGSAQ